MSKVVVGTAAPARGSRPHPRIDARWLAVFVVVTLTATVLVLWGLGRAAGRTAALVLVQEVAAGAPIPDAALAETGAATDGGVRLVPAAAREEVVGTPAARRLVPGTLLTPLDLASGPVVAAGERTVGARLRAGAFPHVLAAGDRVTALPASLPADAGVAARVLAVADAGSDASVVLVVDEGDAGSVARWSAAGDLVLVGFGR